MVDIGTKLCCSPCLYLVSSLLVLSCVLLSISWGFQYGTINARTCWAVFASDHAERAGHVYTGLPSMDSWTGQERSDKMELLYAAYSAAVGLSGAGLTSALHLRLRARELARDPGERSPRYPSALCRYFCVVLLNSMVALVGFAEHRCHYHNVGWEAHHPETFHPSRRAKGAYLMSAVYMSFFMNVMLESTLEHKAALLGTQISGQPMFIKFPKFCIDVQIISFILGVPLAAISVMKRMYAAGEADEGTFGPKLDDIIREYQGPVALFAFSAFAITAAALAKVFAGAILRGSGGDVSGGVGSARKASCFAIAALSITSLSYGYTFKFGVDALGLAGVSIFNASCMLSISLLELRADASKNPEDCALRRAAAEPAIVGQPTLSKAV